MDFRSAVPFGEFPRIPGGSASFSEKRRASDQSRLGVNPASDAPILLRMSRMTWKRVGTLRDHGTIFNNRVVDENSTEKWVVIEVQNASDGPRDTTGQCRSAQEQRERLYLLCI